MMEYEILDFTIQIHYKFSQKLIEFNEIENIKSKILYFIFSISLNFIQI